MYQCVFTHTYLPMCVYTCYVPMYLQDDIPESDESLLINITRVRIADEGDREGSSTPSPRVLESAQVVEVIIEENDNNRGLLNFQVASVRVEEVPGSQVVVEVTRIRGLFGSISVEYSINEDTAISSSDYEPAQAGTGLTGMLSFETGQDTALINITIVNDQIPERDERFAVVLMNAIGGAEIGTQASTEIIIESNDDINGVFSFADNSLLVRRGKEERVVVVMVIGIQGVVVIVGGGGSGDDK